MRSYAIAATAMLLAGPALAQGVGQSIDVGGWTVRRVQSDNGVQSCIAVQAAEDKTAVGFGGSNQMQGFLMLIDAGAKNTPGKEVALEYKVDKGKTAKAMATAVNPSTLVLSLGTLNDVAPFFTAVEEGDNIHLETATTEYDYSLKGSKAALAALTKCIEAAMIK